MGMKIKILKDKWCGMRKLAKIENPGSSTRVGIYEILRLYSQFRTKSEVVRL